MTPQSKIKIDSSRSTRVSHQQVFARMKVLLIALLVTVFVQCSQIRVGSLETKKIGSNYECEACIAFFNEGDF